MSKELRRKIRYRAEKRFQVYGIVAISLALFFVGLLIVKIFSEGSSAFSRTMIKVQINFDSKKLGITDINNKDEVENADYYTLVYEQFTKKLSLFKQHRKRKS